MDGKRKALLVRAEKALARATDYLHRALNKDDDALYREAALILLTLQCKIEELGSAR